MTTTSNVSTSSKSIIDAINSAGKSSTGTTTNSASDIENRFLTLLVTQLKNQDPLNPADANQMTTQLSQISTVSGIEKLNTNMQKLLDAYGGTQNMQAAALIGKTVLSEGSNLELGSSGAIGGVKLGAYADKVTISIKDANGKEIQTQSLGAQNAGVVNFYWDGKDSSGTAQTQGKYTFTVTATKSGEKVDAAALQAGTVYAVTLASDGTTLQLSNSKTIAYSDIQQIMN